MTDWHMPVASTITKKQEHITGCAQYINAHSCKAITVLFAKDPQLAAEDSPVDKRRQDVSLYFYTQY